MKNKYKIDGEVTTVFIEKKNGTILEMLIDTEDLPKLKEFNSINASYYRGTEDYYATVTEYLGWNELKERFDNKTILIHRFIVNAKKGRVDHKNHKTLDNRKSNLRTIKGSNNSKNRKSKKSNNTSGYRNVSWSQSVNS